jgi:hypothetical protein
MGERGEEFDALHGIESEIEFETVGGVDGFLQAGADGFGDDGQGGLHAGRGEPLAVFFGKGPLGDGDLALISGACAFVEGAEFAVDLVAAQFAGGGAGKILLPDVIGEDSLGGRESGGDALDVVADDLADVDDAVAA